MAASRVTVKSSAGHPMICDGKVADERPEDLILNIQLGSLRDRKGFEEEKVSKCQPLYDRITGENIFICR